MTDPLVLLMLPGLIIFAIGVRYGFEEVEAYWPCWLMTAGISIVLLSGWAPG